MCANLCGACIAAFAQRRSRNLAFGVNASLAENSDRSESIVCESEQDGHGRPTFNDNLSACLDRNAAGAKDVQRLLKRGIQGVPGHRRAERNRPRHLFNVSTDDRERYESCRLNLL